MLYESQFPEDILNTISFLWAPKEQIIMYEWFLHVAQCVPDHHKPHVVHSMPHPPKVPLLLSLGKCSEPSRQPSSAEKKNNPPTTSAIQRFAGGKPTMLYNNLKNTHPLPQSPAELLYHSQSSPHPTAHKDPKPLKTQSKNLSVWQWAN